MPSDRAFVLSLAARFASTRAGWRDFGEVLAGTQRQLAAAFDTPVDSSVILIADDELCGDRVGFAYIVTHADFFSGESHGHVSEIAAVADRSGAGSALMAASEAWSRERGYRYLSLNVNDANEGARRFYERHAYQPEYRHLIKLL